MISGFDASILIPLFDAAARVPDDPETGKPVTHFQERIRFLLNQHVRAKGSRIIIPAPALSEFLVRLRPDAAADYVGQLHRVRGCRIAPFAYKAAIEFADMQRAILAGERRRTVSRSIDSRAKAKFDQQIVAIAKAEQVETMYTDDEGLAAYAQRFGISSIGLAQLPLSPDSRQGVLQLDPPEPSSGAVGDDDER